MTYNELTYMVLDELKISSDDAYFTEDHVIFLLTKYRSFLLKQRYSDIRKQIPDSNYQDICLELIETNAISGDACTGGTYLRSKEVVPTLMPISSAQVYPQDFFQGEITVVPRERLRYIGHNKFLKNIIYCAKAPDGYLYFKSPNPQHKYLEQVRYSGVFEDPLKASELSCSEADKNCELGDREFPLETALVPPLLELVVNELRGPKFIPEDDSNNAKDDTPNMRD